MGWLFIALAEALNVDLQNTNAKFIKTIYSPTMHCDEKIKDKTASKMVAEVREIHYSSFNTEKY